MCEFKSEKEMETKLNEISQRMCQCNFTDTGGVAFTACLLEAKGIITPQENHFIKEIFDRGACQCMKNI